MTLLPHHFYHYYNQGNNRQKIFFSAENYAYFLDKVRSNILPHAEIVSYCLMPNHFHFLLYLNEDSVKSTRVGSLEITRINNGFRLLQSSYAKAINKERGRSGSLFRQKVQTKLLETKDKHYPLRCFHYIHQNPLAAGLVNKMEDWPYSSFQEYLDRSPNNLCNSALAYDNIGISQEHFYDESYGVMVATISGVGT